ncbi:hypothetical protein [uncultured Gammaproteobacteria bacterium]|nr:hypothetical protein [uncultured Gammaproteobacteria bacterium]
MWCWIKSSFVDLDGWKNGGFGLVGVVFKGRLNTTFQNYDDIVEKSCQAWNEILSEDGFIKNLCSREWSLLV